MNIPAVVMTGATTWNPVDNSYHNTHHFNPETAQSVLNVYQSHKLPTFVYTLRDDMINIYHLGPLSCLEKDFIRNRLSSPYKRFILTPAQEETMNRLGDDYNPDLTEKIWEESINNIPQNLNDGVLFFAMQPAESGEPVFKDLRKINDINPMYYFDTVYPGMAMIEAFPAAASKANAIKHLAKTLGAERIVAFGDNRNDLPMLKLADVAVAVENAIQEVKNEADIIIGSCNDCAVADFILNDYLSEQNSQTLMF